jgi:ubiquinone biosynthesis protein UbiJ
MRLCFAFGVLVLLASTSFGQSLGDVARELRQKQSQSPQKAPEVITNDDLPQHGEDDDIASANPQNSPSLPFGSKSAEQWKAEIAAQRNVIASLQSHIDKLNNSIHFASAACVYHCVEHNENQLKKQDEVQRLQEQLNQAKARLDQMQEQARHEGFGNAVYEP